LPDRRSEDKPHRIDGFVPDVYASTFPRRLTVVGEAKCNDDLTSRRTAMQLRAFLEHLRYQENGQFVIAVEERQALVARRIVRLAAQEVGAENLGLYSLSPFGRGLRIDAAR
jgi:hypothetical protein